MINKNNVALQCKLVSNSLGKFNFFTSGYMEIDI